MCPKTSRPLNSLPFVFVRPSVTPSVPFRPPFQHLGTDAAAAVPAVPVGLLLRWPRGPLRGAQGAHGDVAEGGAERGTRNADRARVGRAAGGWVGRAERFGRGRMGFGEH